MKMIDLHDPQYNIGTFDDAIDLLIKFREKGEIVSCYFNGHYLSSEEITVDSAYKSVFGLTKEEFLNARKEYLDEEFRKMKLEKKQSKGKIPEWIHKGKNLIYPQKIDDWKRCVDIRSKDIYHGKDLDHALEIMTALEEGKPFDEVNQIVNSQHHSGMSYRIVMSIVTSFSKVGPEFYEAIDKNITPERKEYLNNQKELNKQYALELQNEMEK